MKATKLAKSIFAAASTYLRLRDRLEHPVGEFDNAGRFFPVDRCDCCSSIRSPSRAYPYSHMVHARSVVHVAHAAGLADYLRAVRQVANKIDKDGLDGATDFLVSKPFTKLLASTTTDVKAAKAAARAAKKASALAEAARLAHPGQDPCESCGEFVERFDACSLCGTAQLPF